MDDSQREGRVVATIPADTFAHRLLLIRAEHGHMTVKDAAARCGLNYGAWSKWERGALPRDKVEVAEAIAEGLGVDRDWLLHGGPLTAPTKPRRVRATYPFRRFDRPGAQRRPRRVDHRDRVPA